MDSGLTRDQWMQMKQDLEERITRADRSIEEFERNEKWRKFQENEEAFRKLTGIFLVEIHAFATLVSNNKDDFRLFFTDEYLQRLDGLKSNFQKIMELNKAILTDKAAYDDAKTGYDNAIQLKKQWRAKVDEIELMYAYGNAYRTRQSNINDNTVNRDTSLGRDY